MEAIDFYRRAQHGAALQITGHITASALLADIAPTAAADLADMELPVITLYQQPLQDSSGRFFFMPDFDVPGDPNVVVR